LLGCWLLDFTEENGFTEIAGVGEHDEMDFSAPKRARVEQED
jgi:hypothetical protein